MDIPVKNKLQRGVQGTYPIKLFYTSNIPIILQTALVSQFYFISQLLFKRFPTVFFIQMIGAWQEIEGYAGQFVPVGGLLPEISCVFSFFQVWLITFHHLARSPNFSLIHSIQSSIWCSFWELVPSFLAHGSKSVDLPLKMLPNNSKNKTWDALDTVILLLYVSIHTFLLLSFSS